MRSGRVSGPHSYHGSGNGGTRGAQGRSSPARSTSLGRWSASSARLPRTGPGFASCVARELGRCDHDYPRWGVHTLVHVTTPRARRAGFSYGSELPQSTWRRPSLFRFAPPRCPKPSPSLCGLLCQRTPPTTSERFSYSGMRSHRRRRPLIYRGRGYELSFAGFGARVNRGAAPSVFL